MIAGYQGHQKKVAWAYRAGRMHCIRAGLPYDSDEGRRYAGEIVKLIQQTARETSRALAEEKGRFPEWENSIYYPDEKIRNATGNHRAHRFGNYNGWLRRLWYRTNICR